MTVEEIPTIVGLMNSGNEHPEGVMAVRINRNKNVYSHVYFTGLGMYKVDITPPRLEMTDEEVQTNYLSL